MTVGADMRRITRGFLLIIAAIIVLLSFFGCGAGKADERAEITEKLSAEASAVGTELAAYASETASIPTETALPTETFITESAEPLTEAPDETVTAEIPAETAAATAEPASTSVATPSPRPEKTETAAAPTPTPTVVPTQAPATEEPKAKVILLCGQSNAAGVSYNAYLDSAVGADRAGKMRAGFENVKIIYHNSALTGTDNPFRNEYVAEVANRSETFVNVKAGQGWHKNQAFFGPELGLAEYLSEAYPDETFYIVKHALGSSTIGDYLPDDPMANDLVSYDSYGELRRLFDSGIQQIKDSSGLDAEVVAICWVQGESEAGLGGYFANAYKSRQQTLLNNFRRDYAAYAPSQGIAFIDVTSATTVNTATGGYMWPSVQIINSAKKALADSDEMCRLIDVNANGIVCTEEPEGNVDIAHYDSGGMIKLGRLMGACIEELLNT